MYVSYIIIVRTYVTTGDGRIYVLRLRFIFFLWRATLRISFKKRSNRPWQATEKQYVRTSYDDVARGFRARKMALRVGVSETKFLRF